MTGTFTEVQQRFLERHQVARLATTGADGRPHVVPICFAMDAESLYSPIDEKPKRVGPTGLKRIRNIQENPRVAVVVDDYSEDWSRLAYLLIRGSAEIVSRGPVHDRALRLLRERYHQYRAMALEERPVLKITPDSVVAWGDIEGGSVS